jgi:hypothetical protein
MGRLLVEGPGESCEDAATRYRLHTAGRPATERPSNGCRCTGARKPEGQVRLASFKFRSSSSMAESEPGVQARRRPSVRSGCRRASGGP